MEWRVKRRWARLPRRRAHRPLHPSSHVRHPTRAGLGAPVVEAMLVAHVRGPLAQLTAPHVTAVHLCVPHACAGGHGKLGTRGGCRLSVRKRARSCRGTTMAVACRGTAVHCYRGTTVAVALAVPAPAGMYG